MTHQRSSAVIAFASVLLMACCNQTQTPAPAPQPDASKDGLQADMVKRFSFKGGNYKDGRISVASGYEVVKGEQKNVVTLQRDNDNKVTINCWCTLEGGDCWALSTDNPDGSVEVGCVSANCASGQEPFCFMDILGGDSAGFNIRLVVASRK